MVSSVRKKCFVTKYIKKFKHGEEIIILSLKILKLVINSFFHHPRSGKINGAIKIFRHEVNDNEPFRHKKWDLRRQKYASPNTGNRWWKSHIITKYKYKKYKYHWWRNSFPSHICQKNGHWSKLWGVDLNCWAQKHYIWWQIILSP